MHKINVELDANNDRGRKGIVYAVYGGIKELPFTHNLIIMCSSKSAADYRAKVRNRDDEILWMEDKLEYWVEQLPLDHLFGDLCMIEARKHKKKIRSNS